MWRRGVLTGALNYIAGADGVGGPATQVTRLVDRIKSAALPHDRRSAIIELTALAREGPMRQRDIGEAGMVVFAAILDQDREFEDTVRATLELLINVCGKLEGLGTVLSRRDGTDDTSSGDGDRDRSTMGLDSDVLAQESAMVAADNTTAFAMREGTINSLIELLDKEDFHLRFNVIELLTAMVSSNPHLVQEKVLAAPMGVTKLVDTLKDSRDIIRNEMLLLLVALSDGSADICKILAFENIFDRLFEVIDVLDRRSVVANATSSDEDDDDIDGIENLVVVQDCLTLINNLLRGCNSNQRLFRETGCIPRLNPVLDTKGQRMSDLPPQALTNLQEALQTIELLTLGPEEDSLTNRTMISTTGLFKAVLRIAFAEVHRNQTGVTCKALATLVSVIRGHDENRRVLGTVSVPAPSASLPEQRPALLATFDMCCESESLAVRAAAFELLREALRNDFGNSNDLFLDSLVAPLKDKSDYFKVSLTLLAQRVKRAAVSWPDDVDGATVFYSADLVAWALLDAATPKISRNQLLGARVEEKSDVLFSRCFRSLSRADRENGPPEVRIGILKLLCVWMYGSTETISTFLSSAMHLPLIVDLIAKKGTRGDVGEVHVRGLAVLLLSVCLEHDEEVSQIPKAKLIDIVRNRIGITTFTSRLDELRASDAFVSALTDSVQHGTSLGELLESDRTNATASRRGELGHSMWYNHAFAVLFNSVYTKLHHRVVELVAAPLSPTDGLLRSPPGGQAPFGSALHPSSSHGVSFEISREEVRGYKEVIRQQDRLLSELRQETAQLKAALEETRREADSNTNRETDGVALQSVEREVCTLQESLQSAQDRAQALETLLQEKNNDFAALSKAYSDLESDLNNHDSENSLGLAEATKEREVALRNLDKQKSKLSRLEQMISQMEIAETDSENEIKALKKENEHLRSIMKTEVDSHHVVGLAEVAALRRRAEVAEASLSTRTAMTEDLEADVKTLRQRLDAKEAEDSKNASMLQFSTERVKELENESRMLKLTHNREVENLRQSLAAANDAAREEIVSLRAEIDTLRSGESETRLRDTQAEIEALQVSMTDREKTIAELHADLKDNLDKIGILSSKTTELSSALADSRRLIETLRQEKTNELNENSRLSTLVRELQATADAATETESSRAEMLEMTRKRVTEVESQLNDKDEMMNQADEMIRSLRDELTSRSDHAVRLAESLHDAEEKALLADEKTRAARESVKSLEHDRSQIRKELEDVRQRFEASNESLFHERDGVREKLKSLQDELETTSHSLEKERDQARAEAADIAKELQANVESLTRERDSAQSQLEMVRLRLTSELQEMADKMKASNVTRDELSAALAESRRTTEQAQRENEVEAVERARLSELVKDMRATIETLTLAESSSSEMVTIFRRRMNDMERDLKEKDSSLSQAEDLARSLREEVADGKSQMSVLSQRLLEADANSVQADKKRREADASLQLLTREFHEAKEKINDLDTSRLSLEQERDQLQLETQRLDREANEKMQLVEERELENQRSMQSTLRERDEAVAELKEVKGSTLADLESLKRENKNLQAELNLSKIRSDSDSKDMAEKLGAMTEEVSQLSSALDDAERLVEQLRKQKGSDALEKERLSGLVQELQATTDALTRAESSRSEMVEIFRKRVVELEMSTRSKGELLSDAEKTISSLKTEAKSESERVEDLSEKLREAGERAALSEEQNRETHASAQSLRMERDGLLSQLQAAREELRSASEKSNLDLEEARNELLVVTSELESKLGEMLKNNEELDTKTVALAEALDEANHREEQLRNEKSREQEEKSRLAVLVEELQTTTDTLKHAESSSAEMAELFRKRVTELEKTLRDQEDISSKTKERLESLEVELEEVREQSTHFSETLRDTKESLSEEQQNTKDMRRVMKIRSQELEQARQQVSLLEERIRQAEDLKNELLTQNSKHTDRQKELERSVKTIQEERANALSKWERQLAAISDEKLSLQDRVCELEEQLKIASKKMQGAESEKKSIDLQLHEAKVEMERIERESRENAEDLKDQLAEALAEVTRLAASATGARDEFETSTAHLTASAESLSKERDQAVSELRRLKDDYREIEELKDELLRQNGDHGTYHDEMEAYLGSIQEDYENNLRGIELMLQEAVEAKDSGDNRMAELERQLDEAEKLIEDAISDRDVVDMKLQETRRRLEESQRESNRTVHELQTNLSAAIEAKNLAMKRAIKASTNSSGGEVLTRRIEELEAQSRREKEAKDAEITALREALMDAEAKRNERFGDKSSSQSVDEGRHPEMTAEAFRKLEQEHSDLLVCLAEIELECNSYKEQLEQVLGHEANDERAECTPST